MSHPAARLTAAAFRAIGVDAYPVPDSDDDSLALGASCSGGEECLPHKVTLGDFLRIARQSGFAPSQVAFFMPKAPGPCRFGQYSPYLQQVLREQGLEEVLVFSPSSGDHYAEIGEAAGDLVRTVWMAMVCSELADKCLHKTRPYETTPGDSDETYQQSLSDLEETMETPGFTPADKVRTLQGAIARMRDRFHAVPARYTRERPLIGVGGEIFCRMNTFSNDDLIRRVEQLGGECWLAHVPEWLWYTHWTHEADTIRTRGRFNLEYLKQRITAWVQHRYEHTLAAPLADELVGYEEPADIRSVIDAAAPYLPAEGVQGEMVLSIGKAIYLYEKGADGIIDISPFTCMNGIICEAVYPAVSDDHDGLPIRSCYFDRTQTELDRDLEIFLDLARAYQSRKQRQRVFPACFEQAE